MRVDVLLILHCGKW